MTKDQIIPIEDLLVSGVHIGVKFRTAFMKPYIYKIRPDGLSVLDTEKIVSQISNAAKLLSNYDPKDILIASRRENAWKPVRMFAKIVGAREITGRYVPGTITNPDYEEFYEPRIVIVTDPWNDRNVLRDAIKISVPIIALCDSNNTTRNVELCIPCNNKGKKSIAMVYWLLTREYLKQKKVIKNDKDFKYSLEDFTSQQENSFIPKKPDKKHEKPGRGRKFLSKR
ncbi:MAG: 30S ribosomal protein S2 [Nanoarchaeota archaeon]|nr:30S ribosomal protein S2 [Nanoarchaeota archaeon]